jgi:hypothetical protein
MGISLLNRIYDTSNLIYVLPHIGHRQIVALDLPATHLLVTIAPQHLYDSKFDASDQLQQPAYAYRKCGTHATTLLFALSPSNLIILFKNHTIAQDKTLKGD